VGSSLNPPLIVVVCRRSAGTCATELSSHRLVCFRRRSSKSKYLARSPAPHYCKGKGIRIEIVYSKSCNFLRFGRKMVRNAVRNAFLNTLTTASPYPCVPAAFQQWERCFPSK